MDIAIFGSCVSRDTCEFIPDAQVIAYIARQSVTSLESPHGTEGIEISSLHSAFQHRMVTSDLNGNGAERITRHASDLDLVLIDLVDERRGYWQFPDGTTMTNSLELEVCGATRQARRVGARLVEFGTGLHFEKWKAGFERLIGDLKSARLWEKTILLDIEWAAAIDGAQHPQRDSVAKLGRQWRKFQRGIRESKRGLARGQGLADAVSRVWAVEPTEAELFADRAATANADYVRYREVANSLVASTVSRASSQVRINRSHKWGPQPFHYRDEDYRSIVQSVLEKLEASADPQSGPE